MSGAKSDQPSSLSDVAIGLGGRAGAQLVPLIAEMSSSCMVIVSWQRDILLTCGCSPCYTRRGKSGIYTMNLYCTWIWIFCNTCKNREASLQGGTRKLPLTIVV
uniref:Uncharacterized protein n=1 Tax=Opuntia streptacantha TaxID=393608 RepID=A0A7C9ELF6_OPUST